MYQKENVPCYQYNNPSSEQLKKVLAPEHTALLLSDMQNDFISSKGKFSLGGRDSSAIRVIVPTCKALLDAARAANVFVVHIQQATLPYGQSDGGGWLAFKSRDGKAPDYALPGTWGWEHVEDLKPYQDISQGFYEPVIRKYRPDAFLYTALDTILRANHIETVVCCGCTTEGCVLATVMGAAFHDYYTCVAEDAVATSVLGAHEHALWLMRKRYIVRCAEEIATCWIDRSSKEESK